MTPNQRSAYRSRADLAAERGAEAAEVQRRLKREAAERRLKASAATPPRTSPRKSPGRR
jgi:hypothetical protein